MSTSIAAQPAYKTSKSLRTKARADRTIFGTTLDAYKSVSRLLQDSSAQSEAQSLFERRHKKWRTPSPYTQSLQNNAWGIKNFLQPEIAEEYARGYSRLSVRSEVSTVDEESIGAEEPDISNERPPTETPNNTPLVAYKNKFGVYNVTTDDADHTYLPLVTYNKNTLDLRPTSTSNKPIRASTATATLRHSTPTPRLPAVKRRPKTTASVQKSTMNGNARPSRRSTASSRKTTPVPKFHFPPGVRNPMRTASLKITETGAKDLINSDSINKIGLGDTMQYNHEAFKVRGVPNAYRDHGDVFSLGQKGNSLTTNQDVTAPGGFYRMSTPERLSHAKYTKKDDGSVYSVPYEPSIVSTRRTYDAKRKERQPKEEVVPDPTPDLLESVIPTNIFHKFGAEEVKSLLKGREQEVKKAIHKAKKTNLSHTGMVPPRVEVPELNHPIDPPASYYTNYGQNLKYDKFEGGLHLYIH